MSYAKNTRLPPMRGHPATPRNPFILNPKRQERRYKGAVLDKTNQSELKQNGFVRILILVLFSEHIQGYKYEHP
jgi:hypothetical protein